MNAATLLERANQEFDTRVQAVGPRQWDRPTPCPEWDVRGLVNHLVAEDLWVPPLMAGRTIDEVGDRFAGDVLGDDPDAAWNEASAAAVAAVREAGTLQRPVHLSFGDVPAEEYVMQLFADHLIHAWDLARAIAADDQLAPDLVDACAAWFSSVEDDYREAGMIGPRPETEPDADPQTVLLAAFGRSA